MTAVTTRSSPSTSTSVTPHQVWLRTRGLLLAVLLLVVAAIALAATRSGDQHGRLDPRSADPYGSRAIAELLKDHGISVRVVTTLRDATDAAGSDTTLLVTTPNLLTLHQQNTLRTATSGTAGRTVLLGADPTSVSRLAPGVQAKPPPPWSHAHRPASFQQPAEPAPSRRAASGTTRTASTPSPATPRQACPPCSSCGSPQGAIPSCSAPRTSCTTSASTARETRPWPFNSLVPARI